MPRAAQLPPIGEPARRALASLGITGLEDLETYRAEDLLALHGVGPRALAQLRTALAESGRWLLGEGPERQLREDVQQYIAAVPDSHRQLFERLHDLILDELPDADVVISYQIPLYKVGRRHVGLNAGRAAGVTLTTTSPDHIEVFRRRHPELTTGKASIQFDLTDEVPEEDVREVVRRATGS